MGMSLSHLVIATHNQGKLREFGYLLADTGWKISSLKDISVTEAVAETGATFAENARIKAVAYSQQTELPVLADDSGLEVAALGGRPGIFTTRYAGPKATDNDRMTKLLRELAGRTNRDARFYCALALAVQGTVLLETNGECPGIIAEARRGREGFGYDPIFFLPELNRTYAELTETEKNQISHRARAIDSLLRRLRAPQPDLPAGHSSGIGAPKKS